MARPSRSAMYADDATFLWKAILRFLAILLAIIGIGTTAWAMTSQIHSPSSDTDSSFSNDYENDDFFNPGFVYLPWQYITLGLSILWNIANISTLLARNRAIHPGANVACDLLLWLGLLFTGAFATIGATNYIYFSAYDDDSFDDDSGFGGGTYSNGTQYEYAANGTTVPVTNQCGGFTTCAAMDQYISAIQHKGIVIAVGASMAFIVLLFHFALFISACRSTNDRRRTVTSLQARAITAEATEIARRMIADMTGPHGAFIPMNQSQHHGGSYQPLQQSEAGDVMEMRQRQPTNQQPGYDYEPVQRGEVEEGPGEQVLGEEGVLRRQYEQTAAVAPGVESSSSAVRRGKQRAARGPDEEIHPALRDDPDVMSHAV
ncbi:MAG: hypothetical protein ASARMPRED_005290 [Alectoria sarmentosa]|nr:MAG: hypothetical protein ASARMPRED_005290 [Alectoria sarmentosa]